MKISESQVNELIKTQEVIKNTHIIIKNMQENRKEYSPRDLSWRNVDLMSSLIQAIMKFNSVLCSITGVEDIFSEKKEEKFELNNEVLTTTLTLVMEEEAIPPESVLNSWTEAQRKDVFDWASSVHLEASDNNIKVPDVPQILRNYEEEYKKGLKSNEENEEKEEPEGQKVERSPSKKRRGRV